MHNDMPVLNVQFCWQTAPGGVEATPLTPLVGRGANAKLLPPTTIQAQPAVSLETPSHIGSGVAPLLDAYGVQRSR